MTTAEREFTHYSYLGGPEGMREPTGIYSLSTDGPATRRRLLHSLMRNGELLSALPPGVYKNMAQLREHLVSRQPKPLDAPETRAEGPERIDGPQNPRKPYAGPEGATLDENDDIRR